jgi:putative endonuclease
MADETPPPEFARRPFWRRWFGRRSERVAAGYLRKKGFRLLAANVADRRGELDLLALDPDGATVVVVEVRSVSGTDPHLAAETVDARKQRKIAAAALRFVARRKLLNVNVRLDVLALAWPPAAKEPRILHIPGAFESLYRFQMWS